MVDTDLAAAMVPYLSAVAGAYGGAVLDRVRDSAADATAEATVGLGRRLLRWLLQRPDAAAPVITSVQQLAQDPADEDRVPALRLQLRELLRADPQLAAELAELMRDAPSVTAAGDRSVAVQHNTGIVQTGDGSSAWQQR